MISESTTSNQIFLIDMGLATPYQTFDRQSKSATFNGTPMFISSSAARGWSMSPRDDLESLGYLLLYMLRGQKGIPWRNVQDYTTLGTVKLQTSVNDMVKGLEHMDRTDTVNGSKGNVSDSSQRNVIATTVHTYLTTVRNTSPNDIVNYNNLRQLFRPFLTGLSSSLIFRSHHIPVVETTNDSLPFASSGQKRIRSQSIEIHERKSTVVITSSPSSHLVGMEEDGEDGDNHSSETKSVNNITNQVRKTRKTAKRITETVVPETRTESIVPTVEQSPGILGSFFTFVTNLWYGNTAGMETVVGTENDPYNPSLLPMEIPTPNQRTRNGRKKATFAIESTKSESSVPRKSAPRKSSRTKPLTSK